MSGKTVVSIVVYRCERGHETPYYGGPLTVISCPAMVSAKTRCGAKARLQPPKPQFAA